MSPGDKFKLDNCPTVDPGGVIGMDDSDDEPGVVISKLESLTGGVVSKEVKFVDSSAIIVDKPGEGNPGDAVLGFRGLVST